MNTGISSRTGFRALLISLTFANFLATKLKADTPVDIVTFSLKQDKLFASGGTPQVQNTILISERDAESGNFLRDVADHGGGSNAIAASRSGSYVAVANSSNSVSVYDAAQTNSRHAQPKTLNPPHSLAFDYFSDDLAIASTDGTSSFIETSKGFGDFTRSLTLPGLNIEVVKYNPAGAGEIDYCSVSQNQWGISAITASGRHRTTQTNEEGVGDYCGEVACVKDFDFSGDGTKVVAIGMAGQGTTGPNPTNKQLRLRCEESGDSTHFLELEQSGLPQNVDHVGLSSDGKLMAFCNALNVWIYDVSDATNGKFVKTLDVAGATSLNFSRITPGLLAVGLSAGNVRTFKL